MIASRLITGIMACDEAGGVGLANRLPSWNFPEELAHFLATTAGHCLVMGQRTYQSFTPKAFIRRWGIVLSRAPPPEPVHNVFFASDFETLAQRISSVPSEKKIFVVGGAGLVEDMFHMNMIDYFILSRLPGIYPTDRKFSPEFLLALQQWPKINIAHYPGFQINTYRNPCSLDVERQDDFNAS